MSKGTFVVGAALVCLAAYAWSTGAFDKPSAPARADVLPESAAAALEGIATRPETDQDSYDRGQWRHWTETGHRGCDSRQAALIRDAYRVQRTEDCTITGGVWRSDYDRVRHTDPGELQIDHVIPLAEAHASGAARWPDGRRERFANDPLNLRAVTGSVNQSKSDQDPAEWLPRYDRCAYVAVWVVLKDQYRLSMDRAERRAVERVLSAPTCQKGGGH